MTLPRHLLPPILRINPTRLADEEAALRRRPLPHKPSTLDRMRHLVETTPLSCREIARRTGTSAATVSRRMRAEGWQRPPSDAPMECYTEEGRRTLRRRALAERFMGEAERCIARADADPYGDPELLKRALMFARMAKTFDEIDDAKVSVRRVRRKR